MYLYCEFTSGGTTTHVYNDTLTLQNIPLVCTSILADPAATGNLTRIMLLRSYQPYDIQNLDFTNAEATTQLPLIVTQMLSGFFSNYPV
jgi:hypothetical protein